MGFALEEHTVRGDLFTDTGKWKYTVALDYSGPDFDYQDWNLWRQAVRALETATVRGTSGVSLTKIPAGWTLVVLEPYGQYSHPITVKGGE